MSLLRPLLLFLGVICSACHAMAQDLPAIHNPKMDIYLSPTSNKKICPENNTLINPNFNWNLNPLKNRIINPTENLSINPLLRKDLNPKYNDMLNPMLKSYLQPGNPIWTGLYIFDKNDELIGFISQPNRDVLLCFDTKGHWTCYYIRTPEGTYNLFDTEGEWTGNYLVYDNNVGYNQFNKEGKWTGVHVK